MIDIINDYMMGIGMLRNNNITSENNGNEKSVLIYQNTTEVVPYNEHHVISFVINRLVVDERYRIVVVVNGFEFDIILNENSIDPGNKPENVIDITKGILERSGILILHQMERNSKIKSILD